MNGTQQMAPSRVCAYVLPMMTQAIFGIQELWYAGGYPWGNLPIILSGGNRPPPALHGIH